MAVDHGAVEIEQDGVVARRLHDPAGVGRSTLLHGRVQEPYVSPCQEVGMLDRTPADEPSGLTATVMMLAALAPVVGAVASAPLLGATIISLALWDSAMLWFFVR